MENRAGTTRKIKLLNYYKMLGVSETADVQVIKKAFRQKALLYHPDVNQTEDAKVIFQHLQEAYRILGDAENRRKYDSQVRFIRAINKAKRERDKRGVLTNKLIAIYNRYPILEKWRRKYMLKRRK